MLFCTEIGGYARYAVVQLLLSLWLEKREATVLMHCTHRDWEIME